jgi:eukaryotic-like serine/threonine-protein kinase
MKLADLSKGVQLGRKFRLVEILGRGSYGDVWQADVLSGESDLPPKVALKIYHQQERADEDLFKEAKNATCFVNERLVRVFGVRRMDGLVVMWMEYVPGQTLLKELGEEDSPKPVALKKGLRWLTNIADGLAYLHHQSPPCVHGDLKLDNILVDLSGAFASSLSTLSSSSKRLDTSSRFFVSRSIASWSGGMTLRSICILSLNAC